MAVIALFIFTLYAPQLLSAQNSKGVTFEQIFDGSLNPRSVRGINWMKEGRYYSSLNGENGDVELRKNDIVTGEHEVLLKQSELVPEGDSTFIDIRGYQFSADETKLLIKTDVEQIWRRSTRENYYLFDLENRELSKLTDSEGKQQHAQLSPAGDRAAFVRNNNLFWVDLATGEETQITTDGEKNKIINGAADWVYEEEFSFAKAWFWSPDGKRIAFYRFDESHVKQYTMQEWGGDYPENITFKYPKAGYRNSHVKIGVYHLEDGTTTWMDVGEEKDQYIVRVNWTHDPNTLSLRRMNRLQNRQDLLLADAATGESRIIKTETNEAWIEENDDLTFLNNGKEFIYVSEESGFNHIYHYKMDGSLIRQITTGDWEVTQFLGIDEEKNQLYYMSTEESPLQRHLYRIKLNGRRKKQLTEGEGWHSINMSPDLAYYIDQHSRANTPPVYTLHAKKGEAIRVLEENADLAAAIDSMAFPQVAFDQVTVHDSVTLNSYMIKPLDFDPANKYPVLMFVYGGPGSQQVTDRYSGRGRGLWHRYLASNGYLIYCVDNRGTGGRGEAFKKVTYKNLGYYETEDQIAAAKYLKNLEYVDPERIGIWGWSYGGYMSSFVLAKGHEVIKSAMAVAPVTHWKYYDTIYTERYMQTPQLNPEGYKHSAPLNFAHLIKDDSYLLIHGTGDDNVHMQHTLEMFDALMKNGVQFQGMLYPNRNHGIYGGNTRKHLFEMLTDFVFEKL